MLFKAIEHRSMDQTPKIAGKSSVYKRNLDQTSPVTPVGKRHLSDMDPKVMDMSVEEFKKLFEPLAKKEDIDSLKKQIKSLQDENIALSLKVESLASKCQRLEDQMQAVYIWKNSGNLVVKLDRGGDDVERAKDRLVTLCGEISKQPGIIDKNMIRQLRLADNRKFLFKIFINDQGKAAKIIQNTASLRGTDVSISKDYPKEVRDQQSKLLSVRRFLMKKSTNRPKLRDAFLVDGGVKLSWSLTNGLIIHSGESLEELLRKYGQTKAELDAFLSTGGNQNRREVSSGSGVNSA